jgi:uncharacterized protein YjbJ (UPF0337 family)
MKSSTTDEIEGKFHEVKGNGKERVGQVIDKHDLESESKSEDLDSISCLLSASP